MKITTELYEGYLFKVQMSKNKMYDFMYALLITRSKLVESLGIGIYNYDKRQNSRHLVEVKVEIQPSNLKKFEELCGLKSYRIEVSLN